MYILWTDAELAAMRLLGRVTDIVIHHTAGGSGETVDGIHEYHRSLGWGGIGYHYAIEPGGLLWQGRPVWARGAHCRNGNAGRIGIALLGNYETGADEPPLPQVIATRKLLHALQTVYGNLPILPHYSVPGSNTTCPGAGTIRALEREGIAWTRK